MDFTDIPTVSRASSFCLRCDYRFTDELAARYPSRTLPGGYASIEIRHLDEPTDRSPAITGIR